MRALLLMISTGLALFAGSAGARSPNYGEIAESCVLPWFLIFFPAGSAQITSGFAPSLSEALTYLRANSGLYRRIDVTGYSDTVGSREANQALGMQRAITVKGALVNDGIPAELIVVSSQGESDLLVPTGDGVREAQNRRVMIVVQGMCR